METVNASSSPESQINNNFVALSHQSIYAMRSPAINGLTWAYWGGRWSGYSVADGSLALTNAATNYLTVNRSTGVISTSVLSDSWDDTTNHARVYKLTSAGGVVTVIEDHRTGLNGVHGYMQVGAGSGGGSGGSLKLYLDATELLAESSVTIGVRELNSSAAETTPTTITGTSNNNTVQIGPAFQNGAVNAVELPGGEWTADLYRSVDNAAGDTRAKISLYLKKTQVGTATVTGTGTSRTLTVTGGTPFVAGDYNADPSKCAWVRTPTAYLRVSGYTSSTVVTVECKTGYVNDSAVAYSKDAYISQGSSAEINDTATGHEIVEWFFNTVACSTTDVTMIRFWATTTATSNRTVTVNYGGTSNSSHIHTTMPFQHNSLGGLNDGDYQHVTAAEKLFLTSMPQNSKSTAYTLILDDASKHLLHPSADTTARTFTIPSNASVAFPVGTAVTFVNQNGGGVITISITTDTMRLAGTGATGSRTLAANGIATAIKLTATEWIISGIGLT